MEFLNYEFLGNSITDYVYFLSSFLVGLLLIIPFRLFISKLLFRFIVLRFTFIYEEKGESGKMKYAFYSGTEEEEYKIIIKNIYNNDLGS